MKTTKQLKEMSIAEIATYVKANWKKVNYAAAPYLAAMRCMNKVSDSYECDDGKSIVLYFLSNASAWKGDIAREVKKELNRRVKA